MSNKNEIVRRAKVFVGRDVLLGDLYQIRGIDPKVSMEEVIFTSSRRQLGDAIRRYMQTSFNSYRVHPSITEKVLIECMHENAVMISFLITFEDNHEFNKYKLTNPDEYELIQEYHVL